MLLALVLGVAACGGGGDESSAAPPALGSAPLVERTPDQFEQDMAALRGDVVVVNFWASWCGPCRDEMPDLQQVSTEYAGQPVTFIGVDVSDVREDAAAFLKDAGTTYPTVYDRKGLNGGIATAWSVTALPQTWFVAPDGTRSGRIPRRVSADELRERIDRLLSSS